MLLGSEGVGNPSTVVLTNDAANMASIMTVEVIKTYLVATMPKGIICRKTLEIEYRLP